MVCPPKNTYTSFNYNLKLAETKSIKQTDRDELIDFTFNILSNHFDEKLKNHLQLVDYEQRYHHWYNNLTDMYLPYINENGVLIDEISTWALNGSVQLVLNPKLETEVSLHFICPQGIDKARVTVIYKDKINLKKCCSDPGDNGCKFSRTVVGNETIHWQFNNVNATSNGKTIGQKSEVC